MTATYLATMTLTSKRPVYPIGIPAKFSPEGVVQRYAGNTTVCHVPADSPLMPGLRALYATLRSHPIISKRIHLLPQSSWHMTILDGVREKECEPGMWPPGKEKEPLEECTKDFSQKLRRLGLELEDQGLASPYHVRVMGFDPAVVGIGLEIEGATPEEEKRLRRLRDRLADTFGFRAPNHEYYRFHISLAYLMRHIDGDERLELNELFANCLPSLQVDFELGPIEFCPFENMYGYPRLFYLGEEEKRP